MSIFVQYSFKTLKSGRESGVATGGQCVLVSSPSWGPSRDFSLLIERRCLSWGALSDYNAGLSVVRRPSLSVVHACVFIYIYMYIYVLVLEYLHA